MNPSTIIALVQADLFEREKRGLSKYGTTVDRKDLSELEWLQHAYEEALDLAVYLKKTIQSKKMVKRKLQVGDKVEIISCSDMQPKYLISTTMLITSIDYSDEDLTYQVGEFWFNIKDLELIEE